jgi:hypothetical protein
MDDIQQIVANLTDLMNSGESVTDVDLDQFEGELGYSLPADYRSFLKLRNGGFLAYRSSFDDWPLDQLFSLYETHEPRSLRRLYKSYRSEIPQGFLAIGDGGSYSTTCLCLQADRYGQLFGWDRSDHFLYGWEGSSDFLCSSFLELLGGLEPSEIALEYLLEDAKGQDEPFRSILVFDEEGINKFFREGGQADCRDEKGLTPLMRAVADWPYVARSLIAAGADIEACDFRGRTPLHHAAEAASLDGVRLLLERGADPHAKDYDGNVPLAGGIHLANISNMVSNAKIIRALAEMDTPIDYTFVLDAGIMFWDVDLGRLGFSLMGPLYVPALNYIDHVLKRKFTDPGALLKYAKDHGWPKFHEFESALLTLLKQRQEGSGDNV